MTDPAREGVTLDLTMNGARDLMPVEHMVQPLGTMTTIKQDSMYMSESCPESPSWVQV